MNTQTSPAAPGIRVRHLSLHYGQRPLFDQLNIDIDAGQFTTLLGASGSGKTSLLKMIAGLIAPASGTVLGSDGQPLAGRIAWMGQKDLLYPWLSVVDNVMLGARLRAEKPDRERAERLLAQVGLASHASARPATLSGGMRQRAAIARTLYENRPVVLMDEPFSALDALTRAEIQTLAAGLLADRTVLLITHDPLEACRLSHRLLVLGGCPARIARSHRLTGLPPRAASDADLLKSQAELLQQLLRGTA